ncbi:MAG TPA: 6-phosphogluconolactonase, partial [Acidimicrobiales bacterium]|nr:6-phosphogluconolactonase [Acidimicrobiales bacterium]
MRVEVVPGEPAELAERAAVWVADRMWSAVAERGVAHIAVSGGTTPTAMFSVLAALPVPWTAVHIWQVDERVAPDGDPSRNLVDLQAAL